MALVQSTQRRNEFWQAATALFDWIAKNIKLVLGVVIAATVVGGAAAIFSQVSRSKEEALQEKYFLLEKKATDIKKGFDEAEQQEKVRAANAKAGKPADAKDAPKAKATGDLAKDYGTIPADLEALINEAPTSRAAQMAALNLADLEARHGQADKALAALNKVNASDSVSTLLGALTVNMKADLVAEKGDCKSAVGLWEKITREPSAKFMHDDSKLRMGLCYESMNDLTRAEQLYMDVSTKDEKAKKEASADGASKDAERYLRLLRMKKATRGS